MKKIAIIGIVGLPANYGGFERFVEQLVMRLWNRFDITVFCSKSAYDKHPEFFGKVHLRYLPFSANGISSVFYDIVSIVKAITFADSLLILGVSGCPILFFLKIFHCHAKIIVNIDGIEWKRNKWSRFARWYLHFAEKCAVRYADCIVGDNKVISDYIISTYKRPCELIEYGADNIYNGV